MEQKVLLCPGHGALAQRAAAYSAEGYNCAESVLLASIDQYRLPLDADAARLVSGALGAAWAVGISAAPWPAGWRRFLT